MMGNPDASNGHRYGGVAEKQQLEDRRSKAGFGMLLTEWGTKLFANRAYPKEVSSTDKSSLEALAKQKASDTPWHILFQAINAGVPKYIIGLDVLGLAVLGRADPESGTRPDLDLTPYDAQSHGVSRRHAVLVPTDEGLCLIDLNSANGT